MPNWTSDQLALHESRTKRGRGFNAALDELGGVSREIAGLHIPIIAECKRRGWRYVHSDPTRPTTIGEGVCDFIIFADKGRMFHVECKSRNGKLKTEQTIFISWLSRLGHAVHVITTMDEFFEIVK